MGKILGCEWADKVLLTEFDCIAGQNLTELYLAIALAEQATWRSDR